MCQLVTTIICEHYHEGAAGARQGRGIDDYDAHCSCYWVGYVDARAGMISILPSVSHGPECICKLRQRPTMVTEADPATAPDSDWES
jgi:hypothetical protein